MTTPSLCSLLATSPVPKEVWQGQWGAPLNGTGGKRLTLNHQPMVKTRLSKVRFTFLALRSSHLDSTTTDPGSEWNWKWMWQLLTAHSPRVVHVREVEDILKILFSTIHIGPLPELTKELTVPLLLPRRSLTSVLSIQNLVGVENERV